MALRRSRVLLLAILVVLVLAVVVVVLLSGAGSGFPGEDDVSAWLPSLRVSSAGSYEAIEDRMLLFGWRNSTELRLTFTPHDGGERIREVHSGLVLPTRESRRSETWAAILTGRAAPPTPPLALVIAGGPGCDRLPLPRRGAQSNVRIYLGGLDEDGKVGAIPFQADPTVCTGGFPIAIPYVPSTLPISPVVELRITREDEHVRFRWGVAPTARAGVFGRRLADGDETLTPDEVARPGKGPLLPDLATCLAAPSQGPNPRSKLVILELGPGVRYVDILRAVECGAGHPGVVYVVCPPWDQGKVSFIPSATATCRPEMPSAPADCAPALDEEFDLWWSGAFIRVWADENADLWLNGKQFSFEEMRAAIPGLPAGEVCCVHADRRLPWSACAPLITEMRAGGHEVCFYLEPLDPEFPIHALLRLPVPASGQPVEKVELIREKGRLQTGDGSVEGKAVRVGVPEDALVEETLHALGRLRMAGATGFEFD